MKRGLTRNLQLSGLGLLSVAVVLIAFSELRRPPSPGALASTVTETPLASDPKPVVAFPPLINYAPVAGIPRLAQLRTEIPQRTTYDIKKYTVQAGDSAWSIAQQFGLRPETILWGNNWISAEAGSLQIGTVLNILPVDGVLHIVAEARAAARPP